MEEIKEYRDNIKLKKKDLMSSVFNVIKENYALGNFIKKSYAITLVANGPAPRYYVDVDTAMKRVYRILNGGKLNIKSKLTCKMYYEIAEKFKKIVRENPNDYKPYLMQKVLNTEASSFFMKESAIRSLIYKSAQTR